MVSEQEKGRPRKGVYVDETTDPEAIANYIKRLEEIPYELSEAKRRGDPDQADRLQEEAETLAREISAGGLRGRKHNYGGKAKNHRDSVRNAIDYAIEVIRIRDPAAANHLSKSLNRTNGFKYSPEIPVPWDFA